MSDEEDYSSEDDLDYVPSAGEEVSEEEGSGDEEDVAALAEDAKQDGKVGGRKERRKKLNDLAPRKRRGGIRLEGESAENPAVEDKEADSFNLAAKIAEEKEAKKEETEKKKADDLWSSFLADVHPKSQPVKRQQNLNNAETSKSLTKVEPVKSTPSTPSGSSSEKVTSDESKSDVKTSGKMTITKIFDFAGEEVKITKEVDAASKEAQEELKKQKKEDLKTEEPSSLEKPDSMLNRISVKRPASSGGGGLGGILSKLGKKPKISVLDKSKMDWNTFKKDEGIEEDMKIHNRGKESYLERMAFLNRADVRQFEIEKSLRLSSSKR